jgi:hypothetical protein
VRALVVVLALVPAAARGEDRWSEPYPGVRYLEREAPGQRVFAVVVDLSRPGIALRATRPADRGKTVSDFAAAYGVEVAINGDFFGADFATEGLAMGAGEPWPGSSDGERWSFVAAGAGNRVEIPLPEVIGAAEGWMSEIVGGYPLVVDDGRATAAVACDTSFCRRNPRTAVGLSRDGRTLHLVVVDGRSTAAAGMSLAELAALMIELGAARALNLDGGGSSALHVAAEGGLVNAPSDGRERRVANHLGVAIAAAPDGGPPDASAPALEDRGEPTGGCQTAPGAGGWPALLAALTLRSRCRTRRGRSACGSPRERRR